MCVCVRVSTASWQMCFSPASSGAGISTCAKNWFMFSAQSNALTNKHLDICYTMFILCRLIYTNSLVKKFYWQKRQAHRGYNNKTKHLHGEESFRRGLYQHIQYIVLQVSYTHCGSVHDPVFFTSQWEQVGLQKMPNGEKDHTPAIQRRQVK